MRICIISHEYPPNVISGCGTALTTLSTNLVKKGHKLTIITPLVRTNKRYEKHKNLKIIRIPIFQSKLLSKFDIIDNRLQFSLALRKFKNKFNFSKFDLLHIYDVHDSYFLNKEIINKVPIIISVNDYYSFEISINPLKFPYKTTNFIKRYIHTILTKILNMYYLKKSKYIIANTNYLKRILKKHFKNAEIITIYRGIKLRQFKQVKNKYNSRKILYVGSNMERKGVVYIIKAMKQIVREFPEAQLTIIGEANRMVTRRLKWIVKENNLRKNIKFIPYVESKNIQKYFREANVFVMPALIENLAVTLLEAMASETPIITTAVGGNSEAVEKNIGILIKPKSTKAISHAIGYIFNHPKEAQQMGKEGVKKIKKQFLDKHMTQEVIQVYQDVVYSWKKA